MVGAWAATFALFQAALGSTVHPPTLAPFNYDASDQAHHACGVWQTRTQEYANVLVGNDFEFPTLEAEWIANRSMQREIERQVDACAYLVPPPPTAAGNVRVIFVEHDACPSPAPGGELLVLSCALEDELEYLSDGEDEAWRSWTASAVDQPVDVIVG